MNAQVDRPIGCVALLFAMEEEGRPIAERLSLGEAEQLHEHLPARIRRGRLDSLEIIHCINGVDPIHGVDRIGTESATLTAWLLAETCRPDLLVNAGTCGGFESRGGSIGQAYLASGDLLYNDHKVPIPAYKEQAEVRIPTLDTGKLANTLGIRTGVVSSGASLTARPDEVEFFDREAVIAKDMEATAIGVVARDLGLPFLALKAVTDLVDHPEPSHEAFLRNLASTTARLTDHLEALLRFIEEGRSIQDLAG